MKKAKYLTLTLTSIILTGSLAAGGADNTSGTIAANEYTGGDAAGPQAAAAAAESEPKTGAKTVPPAKVELTFWTLNKGNYADLARAYTREHPNVTIQVLQADSRKAQDDKLAAGSGAPDIYQLEAGLVDQYLEEQDLFYNLNDLRARELQAGYLKWAWRQASSADGSFQLGLPADIGPTVVFYRKDLIEAAGLPGDPEGFSASIDTWTKFAAAAQAVKEKTGKSFSGLADLTYNALRDQSVDEIYYSEADGTFFGDSNPYVQRAYDYTAEGIQAGWISYADIRSPEWEQGLRSGAFAAVVGPAWLAGTLKESAPDSAGQWRIAQLAEGAGNWGGSYLALPKAGKHPEEAYAFTAWLVNKENQQAAFSSQGLIPSIPSLYSDPAFTALRDAFFGGQQTGIEFGKAASRVKPVYYGPLHEETDALFKNALSHVLLKGADPASEWRSAVKRARTLAAAGEIR
ncbi:ABC transporter substrate-binding protein [Paenibacillus piscarius]|uniref:ABC transporter substrate-binding protein n=1 Tax=Paenibacillus piscarius TaxID=1089681 RepID=UPI001EE7E3C6|nr:extracellular solute-binding protein [Paenibacillus piscarius]